MGEGLILRRYLLFPASWPRRTHGPVLTLFSPGHNQLTPDSRCPSFAWVAKWAEPVRRGLGMEEHGSLDCSVPSGPLAAPLPVVACYATGRYLCRRSTTPTAPSCRDKPVFPCAWQRS